MDDLSFKEKYPDSWRADHSNFGDVYGTTYAKGTIKEFKKLQDEPIKVASLVKVEIEGYGVSDFLPLFYHPKPRYWDDEEAGIKATDFNQEGRYFERAWMSFRAGDEVRVLLRENRPYAVVGFEDGVPRIGEDIFQFKWLGANIVYGLAPEYMQSLSRQFQLSKGNTTVDYTGNPECAYSEYNEEKKGPDNLPLYLKTVTDSPLAIRPDKDNPLVSYYFWFFVVGPFAVIFHLHTMLFAGTTIRWGLVDAPSNFHIKLFDKDLKEKILSYLQSSKFDSNISDDIDNNLEFKTIKINPDFTGEVEHSFAFDNWINPDSLEIYVRPHTKDELQEAGMWPHS